MKKILFVILVCGTVKSSIAQSKEPGKKTEPGKQQSVSAGILIPLGDLASTHIGGIGIEYARSDHRIGKLTAVPSKKMGILFEAGLDYYFGKKETVSGYPYDYPGYYFLHVYPGLLYNPCKKGNISLSAGPAMNLYNGDLRFNIGAKLQGTYYLNERTGISPGVVVMKEHGADPLWAASLKATLAF